MKRMTRRARRLVLTSALALATARCARARALAGRSRRAARTAACSRRRISGCSKAPDRAAWQKPDQIMDALGIADGVARWPTSAPAPAGSPCGWRAASGRTAWSTPRTCSGRCSTRSAAAWRARGCRTSRRVLGDGSSPNLPRARARRRAGRRRLPGGRRGPRDVPAQPRRGAQARRAHRHRELQAGRRRPGPDAEPAGRQRASSRATRARPGLRVMARADLPYQYLLVLGR